MSSVIFDEGESARYEFPKMLYRMLQEVSADPVDSKIVSWQEHGRSFKVHNREEVERVLARFFREKYESWRCLLEQWGFIKLSRGKDRGSWYQCNFVRGDSAKLQGISKDDFLKGMPTYLRRADEPDLYAIQGAKGDDALTVADENVLENERRSGEKAALSDTDPAVSAKKAKHDTESGANETLSKPPKSSTSGSKAASNPTAPREDPSAPRKALNTTSQGGCQGCGLDDDHANLLLCETCETEMHIYCLTPPLASVPEDDWFCHSCTDRRAKDQKDLDRAINDLPANIVAKFGEICWARSSDKAEWWPAEICDPRSFLTNQQVVDLARRSIGKKFLVFFFEYQETPFDAVPESRILGWEEGVEKGLHTGRQIRKSNKTRMRKFHDALATAQTEFAHATSQTKHDSKDQVPVEESAGPHAVDKHCSVCGKCGEVVACFQCSKLYHSTCLSLSSNPLVGDEWRCPACQVNKSSPVRSSIASSRQALGQDVTLVDPNKPLSLKNSGETWLAIKKQTLNEVAKNRSRDPVTIDEEVSHGITVRPSGKWQAQIYFEGKSRYIGVFPSRRDAALAFQFARSKCRMSGITDFLASATQETNLSNQSSAPSLSTSFSSQNNSRGRVQKPDDFHFCDDSFNETHKHRKSVPPQGRIQGRQSTAQQQHLPPALARDVTWDSRSTRHSDHERTRLLLSASVCRYYSPSLY